MISDIIISNANYLRMKNFHLKWTLEAVKHQELSIHFTQIMIMIMIMD